MEVTESIRAKLDELRSRKAKRYRSQVQAIESDISRLTVLSSTLFSQLEDALERQHMSRPATAATGATMQVASSLASSAAIGQQDGAQLTRAQVDAMWQAPMFVKSPHEMKRVRLQSWPARRQATVDKQETPPLSSPIRPPRQDVAGLGQEALMVAQGEADSSEESDVDAETVEEGKGKLRLKDLSPTKRSQYVHAPLAGSTPLHAPAASQGQPAAVSTQTPTTSPTALQTQALAQAQGQDNTGSTAILEDDLGNLSSDALAVEEVRFTAADMDTLRLQAQASIARLQRRRRYLRQVQQGHAAYLSRLARTEGQLTAVAGKWEDDERARLEKEAKLVRGVKRGRFSRLRTDAYDGRMKEEAEGDEVDEEEVGQGQWRKRVKMMAEVCAWVGVGATGSALLMSQMGTPLTLPWMQ